MVNALFDDGSNRTLIDKDLARRLKLGLDVPVRLNLEGVSGLMCLDDNSHLCKLNIEAKDGSYKEEIKAATLDKPAGGLKSYRWNTWKKLWAHLQNIDFPEVIGKECELLLGSDYNHLLASRQEIIPTGIPRPHPIARKTLLGWSCTGIIAPGEHPDYGDSAKNIRAFARRYFTQKELSRGRSNTGRVTLCYKHTPGEKHFSQSFNAVRKKRETRRHLNCIKTSPVTGWIRK